MNLNELFAQYINLNFGCNWIGPKANLLAQPLVSSITQHKLPGHIVTLHPRDGHAALWQVFIQTTVNMYTTV